jgi:7-dehydrocholesterol reductase
VSLSSLRSHPWIHQTLVPVLLLVLCPPAVFVFWYVATQLDGSFLAFWALAWKQGFFSTIWGIWQPVFFGSALAWKIIAIYSVSQLFLMKVIPGKPFLGPITPKGHVPVYKANGVPCFLITVTAFLVGSYGFHWFSPTILYDELGPLFGALNCFSLLFCLALYFKGIFAPSTTDCGSSGNFLFDYYWGTELYPRILGWDVKQFTNCRFGMMAWPILILSFAAKQAELYGLSNAMVVSVALQLIYIAKFFIWETGYFRSLDIMHDRAGFMICWGCLVWVPCVYTSPALYLVHHPIHLSEISALAIFIMGCFGIIINYLADLQRQRVRAKNGKCLVWGSSPSLIEAVYETQNGEIKQTVLLASGWWGLSRHFHYIPELCAAFCWSVPALFTNFFPYFYFCFLTILLVDRAFRHDKRCSDKYGPFWALYCEKVPYKLIPYVF